MRWASLTAHFARAKKWSALVIITRSAEPSAKHSCLSAAPWYHRVLKGNSSVAALAFAFSKTDFEFIYTYILCHSWAFCMARKRFCKSPFLVHHDSIVGQGWKPGESFRTVLLVCITPSCCYILWPTPHPPDSQQSQLVSSAKFWYCLQQKLLP